MISLFKFEIEMIFTAYKAADLFLHPSKTEVQPLVVLDAMASGTPFISTDVGCVNELPGGVTINSEEEMANEIGNLLHNSERFEKLKAKGLKASKEKYNWDYVSKQYDGLIRSLK